MSLGFLHPAFLFGTALAAVPIVIHLINRRRARTVQFAAIALVLRSQQRNARKLRLRRLLLLLLRTLLCLVVPLALARPFLAPKGQVAQAATHGPTAVAVVLDTSMSMGYRLGNRTLLDRGKQKALRLVSDLSPEDTVAVLPCADGWHRPIPQATYDLAGARANIRQASLTFQSTDMDACVGAATRVLSGSPLSGKRLVVVTDLTASGWRLDTPPPRVTTPKGPVKPAVEVVDAADGQPLPNRWIDSLEVEPAFALGPKGYSFAFTVRASGGASATNLSATLDASGKVLSRGFVDLTRDGTARKTLSHDFGRGGDVAGAVKLDGDRLSADDSRPFTVYVKRDLKALVVDGAPSVNRYQDEVFFVERALQPGRGSASAIRPTVVDVDALASTKLADYDLVLLLNVHAVPPSKVAALQRFVQGGGGLFVSAGDNVDPDAWNEALGDLLPARFHVVRAADGGETALAAVRWNHPIFSVFVGDARESFASARFQKYLMVRPPPKDTEILATYEDGSPALLYRPFGRGRVILYTSTVDRAWTDLPIRTAFLPMMQQVAGFLARSLDERRDTTLMVGQRATLKVPAAVTEVVVRDPAGHETGFKGQALEAKALTYDHTTRPGLYQVLVRRHAGGALEPVPEDGFVVITDPRESDTSRLPMADLVAHLGGKAVAPAPALAGLEGGDGPDGSRPLWTWFLVLAVLALVAEGWLLRR